jgi:hypothetical protein
MKRVILGALTLALSCVALAAPAHADTGSGTVSGINGVLYDDCRAYPYRYAVDVPIDAQSWRLDVTLIGPNGDTADTGFVGSGEPVSGTSTFFLCPPTDLYGTYTIRATFEWQDTDSVWHPSAVADAHFSMRKPFTRTTLSVSTHRPSYGQVVTYRIGVRDERPEGYVATPFAWVHLQKRVDGHWVRIKGSRTLTHATGRVGLRLRYRHHHKRMRVQAVAEASARFSRSVSPAVRLW